MRSHRRKRPTVEVTCAYCGATFLRDRSHWAKQGPHGRPSYCCREHMYADSKGRRDRGMPVSLCVHGDQPFEPQSVLEEALAEEYVRNIIECRRLAPEDTYEWEPQDEAEFDLAEARADTCARLMRIAMKSHNGKDGSS